VLCHLSFRQSFSLDLPDSESLPDRVCPHFTAPTSEHPRPPDASDHHRSRSISYLLSLGLADFFRRASVLFHAPPRTISNVWHLTSGGPPSACQSRRFRFSRGYDRHLHARRLVCHVSVWRSGAPFTFHFSSSSLRVVPPELFPHLSQAASRCFAPHRGGALPHSIPCMGFGSDV